MNKAELIAAVAAQTGETKKGAEATSKQKKKGIESMPLYEFI